MKAIDLINAMCYDSTLAEQGGTMPFYRNDGGPVAWAADKFRAKIVEDEGLYCEHNFFYLYCQSVIIGDLEWFVKKYPPKILLEDEHGIIYLWRIENE